MRRLFIILGAVLGVVVAVGVFLFVQFSRPVTVEVPVAIDDIPAGTFLRTDLFRVARMANVDALTLAKWILVSEWGAADGRMTSSDIRAGFPVARAQIDPNSPAAQESRLSTVLTGTNDYYIVIPVKPDEVGNYILPGDRIDIIISIGNADRKETIAILPLTITSGSEASLGIGSGSIGGAGSGIVITQTSVPVSKLVLQNLSILRVERDRPQRNTSADAQQDPQPATSLDVKRLYVRVTHDQLEVLSFVLNNGKHTLAVRAAGGSQLVTRTDGVVWDDFVRWLYAQRGNQPNPAQPFDRAVPTK
ncbi:MAG: SAF domain-containing protein [Thermoflexales bacterium]